MTSNTVFRTTVLLFVTISVSLSNFAQANDDGRARAVVVEEIRNDNPAFVVRVDVDRKNRVYRVGDVMTVTVRSSRAGYLYLLYRQADGKVACLFPNQLQSDNKIPANKDIIVPAANARFRLRIAEPTGQEVLKAIVTLKPVKALEVANLVKSVATPIATKDIRAVRVEVIDTPKDWAEHHVRIRTVAKNAVVRAARPQRIGVFIGISDYESGDIRDLSLPSKDAVAFHKVMKSKGDLDHATVLTDKKATLENIENAIRKWAVAISAPGDTVFIYWSGHGARCSDDNGDEKDDLDEYLVPVDGDTKNLETIRKTMLLDDTFGRWIQDLDGRKVLVVLDTCHSGGQHKHAKDLGNLAKYTKTIDVPLSNKSKSIDDFDFFDGEWQRTKDIGQKETAMLASSKASQLSFERREGDLSAMTYFLIDKLQTAPGKVTLKAAYAFVKKAVPEYVQKKFPGTTQDPVLIDYTTKPVALRLR